MSYIFSGLKRNPALFSDGSSFEFEIDKAVYKPPITYEQSIQCFVHSKVEKQGVTVNKFLETDLGDDSWEENLEILWTKNETFLPNSVKVDYLKNIIFHLPKIFFLFRPGYSTQLAIRFAVRNLSGSNNNQEISNIIIGNSEILGYFLQFYKLCIDIYTGRWLVSLDQFDKKFNQGLILATIELTNLLRKDTPEICRIAPTKLTDWGDNSEIISKSKCAAGDKLSISRGEPYDMDMNTVDRFCAVCNQHFSNTELLQAHIQTHNVFVCNICRLQVNTYVELVCHILTFCRSTMWNSCCLYCKNEKDACKCGVATEFLLNKVQTFTKSKRKNNVFASDMISTLTHYFNENNRVEMNEDVEQTFKDMVKQSKDCQPCLLDIDGNKDQINENLDTMLPIVSTDQGKIVSQSLAINCNWIEVKNILEPYFKSYQDAEMQILRGVKDFRIACLQNNCLENFSVAHHLETHSLCPMTRALKAVEEPIRFDSIQKFIGHCCEHIIGWEDELKFQCIFCDKTFEVEEGLNLGAFLMHAAKHVDDKEQVFDSECKENEFEDCKMIKLSSIVDTFFHKLLWHVKGEEGLRSLIRELTYDVSIKGTYKHNGFTELPKHKNWSVVKNLPFNEHKNQKLVKDVNEIKEERKAKANIVNVTDSENDSDDGEQENPNNNVDKIRNIKDNFCCENEKHTKPIFFPTKVALKRHIIENHTCSFKGCTFSAMFEKTLLRHYEIHLNDTMEAKCTICHKIVKNLEIHLREHPRCKSCQVRFENLAILRLHEPSCTRIKQESKGSFEDVTISPVETTSLNVDTTDLESKFSGLIQRLLKDSSLTETEKTIGAQIIEKYTSSNTIAKNRSRIDAINNRRNDALLFDIPNFIHADKPQLHKVLSSIGDIKEEEKFNPSIQSSNQNCVTNFEAFELLLKKIDSLVLLGNLTELLTVALMQRFISQPVIDAISSYQQKNFEDISFQAILESVQWIYIPLKLQIFSTYVLSYTHDKSMESFLEFASKVYRHLKLCSRLKQKDERSAYIEHNQRKILKRNLPLKLLDAIESKESLYTAFTSKEIIDHYVSWIHNQTEGRIDHNKYNVFAMKVKTQPATVRTKSSSQKVNKKRFGSNNKQDSEKEFKNVKSFKGRKVMQLRDDKEKTNKRIPSEASQKKLNKLKEFGIDVSYPICFLCLKKHPIAKCILYKGVKLSDELCIQKEGGKDKPMGYHEECRHSDKSNAKSRLKGGITVWKPRNN